MPIDIDGVQSLAYFEVMEIIDDNNLFLALLGLLLNPKYSLESFIQV
jgi:hypothetical protein